VTRRRAFTLIEVMVAMVIFSLVISSLVMSFRTGVKAYDIGATHSEADQTTRFVTGQIAEDLRNVYYKQPWTYNVTRAQREQLAQEREKAMLQSGSQAQLIDDSSMPELGPRIDLSFAATNNDQSDVVSFVRLQSTKRGETRRAWGLARMRYFVASNCLFRAIDDVVAPESDENGYEIPKSYPPTIDKIANNVKGFDLKFGYYHENEWKVAEDWNSNASQYRNPVDEDEQEQEQALQTAYTGGTTSGPLQQRKSDDLPAWIEITYTFTDPKKVEKERTFTQLIQLAQSQETYIPPDVEGDSPERDVFRGRRPRQ
jgi:prepilin-type N-terminal cleavage/methylation domain-containing protein